MTITVTLRHEAAQILKRQITEGRYPDAETAVIAALLQLDDDSAARWDNVDADAVERLIAESDLEGGEFPLEDVARMVGAI